MQFSARDASGAHLKDSDGDSVKLGTNYVVFVFAIYLDEYKRKLNDFSDFLSAPSKRFCLQNQLKAVDYKQLFIYQVKGKTQELVSGTEPEDAQVKNAIGKWKNMPSTPYILFFVGGDKASFKPQYRCMLLPDYTIDPNGPDQQTAMNYLLTKASFHYLLDEEIEKAESIASKYDPQIQSLQSQLIQLGGDQEQTSRELDSIQGQLTTSFVATNANLLSTLQLQVTQVQDKTTQLEASVKTTQDQLNTAIDEKNTAMEALHPSLGGKPGFFFNTTIAAQVSAGNYTPATVVLTLDNGQCLYAMGFGPETTDNFGNQLTSGSSYIPAVYSASGVEEANQSQFKQALSDVPSTANFTYSE
jgi:flagellar biosynthesis chaperone FliJ